MSIVDGAVGSIPIADLEVGPRRRFWWRARHNSSLIAGATITGVVVALCVLAPLIGRYGPAQQNLLATFQGPSAAHFLGTDDLGRDVWSRLLYAGRTDLQVGVLAIIFPFVFGSLVGTLAGYFGGWFDAVVMRVVDVVLAFPFYVLIISLVFVVGEGTHGIYLAFAITDWVIYARTIRAATLIARSQEWVAAARGGGLSHIQVVLRHILPNTITQVIVYAMSDIVLVILAVVSLGYLGLGIQPPSPDWGVMIDSGQVFFNTDPWLSTVPGIAVVLTGLGLSLVGDGLADVLRPGS